MTKIIGIGGSKQVGKSTTGDIIEQNLIKLGYIVQQRAFADILKQYCVDVLGLDARKLWGTDRDKNELSKYKWEKLPLDIRTRHYQELDEKRFVIPRAGFMSYRDLLNICGTDLHRNYFSDNIWIDALFNKDYSQNDFLIITDVRTIEEVEAVRSRGGIIIKLERTTGLKVEHEIQERLKDWKGYDYHYQNDGSIEQLNDFIQKTLNKIIFFTE